VAPSMSPPRRGSRDAFCVRPVCRQGRGSREVLRDPGRRRGACRRAGKYPPVPGGKEAAPADEVAGAAAVVGACARRAPVRNPGRRPSGCLGHSPTCPPARRRSSKTSGTLRERGVERSPRPRSSVLHLSVGGHKKGADIENLNAGSRM